MKKLTLIFYFLFLINFSQAQNLVPNWSFEDTVACPTALTQINKAVAWSAWRNSPDYFHTCTNGQAGVPNNFVGYQFPKSGYAYAGFLTYTKFATNGREILGVELLQALSIGQKYFLSFFVSNPLHVDNNSNTNGASNKTGVRFSTIEYNQAIFVPIDNYSHIYTDSIITDSIGWVKISGSFIADSAYKFIGIGNFFTDSACTHILFDSVAAFVYYYIDDVKLSTDSNFVNNIQNYSSPDLINIFPNPARDWLTIEGSNVESVFLFDVLGKICLSYPVSASSFKIDVSSLGKGIYFLNIETGQENIIKKIVIH